MNIASVQQINLNNQNKKNVLLSMTTNCFINMSDQRELIPESQLNMCLSVSE